MPESYTPQNEYHDPITRPLDGEKATAGSLGALEQLADNVAYVRNLVEQLGIDLGELPIAYKNEHNSFEEAQTITRPNETAGGVAALTLLADDADSALIGSGSEPGDHPGNSANKWKYVFAWKRTGGQYIYALTGRLNGEGCYAVVTNAQWDVDTQTWSLRDDSQPAHALLWFFDKVRVCGKPASSSPWAAWDVGSGSVETGSIQTSGAITSGSHITGSSVYCTDLNAEGDVNVANDIVAGDDITAGDNITAPHFNHPANQDDTIQVALSEAQLELDVAYDKDDDIVECTGDAGFVTVRVRVPRGGTLVAIDVCNQQASGNTTLFSLFRKSVNWGLGAVSSSKTEMVTNQTDGGTGIIVTSISGGDYVVGQNDVIMLYIVMGTTGDKIRGIQARIKSPGPRNT